MISNGGTVGSEVAAEHPIRAIESGPAAGALAGVWFSRRLECPQLLCFDMGGTTAKACFINNYEAQIISIFEVVRSYRNLPGSGWPAAVPSIDLVEIGAGGGSIASLDALGRVVVGPASAGALPGPACYGRGGERPTVTDANLLLGYIDPEAFAGEELRLEPEAAIAAVGELARSASMDATEMAAGIHEIVNQAMAAAARAHATERGISLRGTPILAFGGGGPIHACGVAELLECPTVFFPPHASVLWAFGALATPVRIDHASTSVRRVQELSSQDIEGICEPLRLAGREALERSGVAGGEIEFRYVVDTRYRGQANELAVAAGAGSSFPISASEMLERFEERYRDVYGLAMPEMEVEVVTWRVTATIRDPALSLVAPEAVQDVTRWGEVRFGLAGTALNTQFRQRAGLSACTRLVGPAVIQEPDTSIILRPGWSAIVLDDGTIRAQHEESGRYEPD